ncbi:unnamed protein product, partial [Hapterophycus canaliculatus]
CEDGEGGCDEEYDCDEEEEEEEEEIVMDEEEYLQMLDEMEPPLSVCQRLLRGDADGAGGCGSSGPWLVLSAGQRASLSYRGFAVLDGLAPARLAAEAYEEAIAREASGCLAPAHGGDGGGGGGSDTSKADRRVPVQDGQGCEDSAEVAVEASRLTGYVKSVRDDLTAFVSPERETTAAAAAAATSVTTEDAEVGAVSRTLAILARLGKYLGRMVRLKGRVEHQLAVYPTGINARYERHRDAYPDDGEDEDDGIQGDAGEEDEANSASTIGVNGKGGGAEDQNVGGSVSFRRITAICYLRGSQGPWAPSDGGALRLYPPSVPAAPPPSAEQTVDASSSSSSSSSNRVVLKCDSQLPSSEWGDLQQRQQQEPEQGIPTPGNSEMGHVGGCGADEDESRMGGDSGDGRPAACGGGRESGDDCSSGGHDGDDAVGGADRHGSGREKPVDAGAGGSRSCCGNGGGGTGAAAKQAFIDVAPVAGRAVIFFSGAGEHEVLPVTGPLPRAALTTWFH